MMTKRTSGPRAWVAALLLAGCVSPEGARPGPEEVEDEKDAASTPVKKDAAPTGTQAPDAGTPAVDAHAPKADAAAAKEAGLSQDMGKAGDTSDAATAGDAGSRDAGPATGSNTATCTHVFGGIMVSEWWAAGFEPLVGNDGWQHVAAKGATPEVWADAGSAPWKQAPASPCKTDSNAPGRVVYYAASFAMDTTIKTAAAWEKAFSTLFETIRQRYPSTKRIDVVTVHRGPGNKPCGGDAKTAVSAAEDQGLAAAAARRPGLVFVGPPFEFASCSFFDGHHYTAEGNTLVARTLAEHLTGAR